MIQYKKARYYKILEFKKEIRMKYILILILTIVALSYPNTARAEGTELCGGAGGSLLCGAGIGGGIGAAIGGNDGAKSGALIGGLIGIVSNINNQAKTNDNTNGIDNTNNIYTYDLIYNTQIALISLGYDTGLYDGNYGPKTKNSIRSYQKNNSLLVNGLPSKELYLHIKKSVVNLYSEE
ncbi:MAG: outer membrane lipoprotein SlyB [Alphaproteobacteria bacterium]|jgi:outer membrane lipoprotein SlyB